MARKAGSEAKDSKSESDTKSQDHRAPASATDDARKTPRKRRKVNHGNVARDPLVLLLLLLFWLLPCRTRS